MPGIVDLDLYRDASTPQLQVILDRQALARAGVSIEDAQRTLETALAGRVATTMYEGERPVPVRLILPLTVREDLDRVSAITVATESGARVPLRDLATLQTTSGLTSINREGNSRYLALKFNIEGRDMGSVVKDAIAAVEKDVKAPDGHYFVWGRRIREPAARHRPPAHRGAAGDPHRARLAVRGDEFRPQRAVGAAHGALRADRRRVRAAGGGHPAVGERRDRLHRADRQVSLMGLLVLSAAEVRRRNGEALLPALVEGASERLRAVLMASTLAFRRLLPMAVSSGVGSETQRPFALVVVGGMLTTLVISLWVLPAIYSYITPARLATPEEEDEQEDPA